MKELYHDLDATPTASYLEGLYKYPQCAFPYEQLVAGNRGRSKQERDRGVPRPLVRFPPAAQRPAASASLRRASGLS